MTLQEEKCQRIEKIYCNLYAPFAFIVLISAKKSILSQCDSPPFSHGLKHNASCVCHEGKKSLLAWSVCGMYSQEWVPLIIAEMTSDSLACNVSLSCNDIAAINYIHHPPYECAIKSGASFAAAINIKTRLRTKRYKWVFSRLAKRCSALKAFDVV